MKTMTWLYDDGGRKDAGYKGDAGDCACRAIAIATGKDYKDVYAVVNGWANNERYTTRKRFKSAARTGVRRASMRRYMQSIGWIWKPIMGIGTGCTVHMRAEELPAGRLIVALSEHYAAVVDGVLHDTHDCTREGMRCVYGYFYK